jgi:adenine specific DNA methylase Mod
LQEEWRELGLIVEDELIQNEHLPVDTKYLSDELKYKILSSFENLDEITDGVLIKSDNFQALNTLMPKYKESIDLIYIDPPFNTGSDFAYKDRFQDSTWLTLMENRLRLSRDLLSEKGSFYLHLDHNANYMGRFLLNDIFGKENFRNEIVWYYGKMASSSNKYLSNNDLIIFYAKSNESIFNKVYTKLDKPKKFLAREMKDGKLVNARDANGNLIYIEKDTKIVDTVWSDIPTVMPSSSEYLGFSTQKPEKLLMRIIYSSTKKDSLILDFFSGSGTTINTAHKLGRKWIGVEMGEHFETVNIPRIKKTIAGVISGISKELEKEGKLKKGGIIKYYELESYEDTLNKAEYSLSSDGIIDLYNSRKLALDKTLNKENGITFNAKAIYKDVDIWESISNVSGWKIKQRFIDRCIYIDKSGKEIEVKEDELYFSEYPFLRDMIWWKA